MPRLPSDQQLGERPVPNGMTPVSGYTAGRAEGAAVAAAQQSAKSGEAFAQVADKMLLAENRILARQEAVSRAKAYGAYSEAADGELRRIQTEADLSDIGTLKGYGEFLRGKQEELLKNYGGSDEGRLTLQEKLEEARVQYASKASVLSSDAQDKVVMSMLGGKINKIVGGAWGSPGSIAARFQDLDKEIADMAPALRPGQEDQFRRSGRERIAEASLGSLIARGSVDAAERLMTTPGLSEILGEQAQSRINLQIIGARQAIANAQNVGLAKRAEFSALFGRPPANDQELMAFAAPGMVSKPDNVTEEVADATSPTGTRLVPRSIAMTPNALTPAVLASFPAGKPSAGLNIEFGDDGKPKSITTGRTPNEQKSIVPGMGTEGTNQIDKELLSALSTRQSLQAMTAKFKPEYQQLQTRLGMAWTALKDRVGDIPAGDKAALGEYTSFRAEVGQNFSQTLKNLSGAAVNPTEFSRAEAYLPNAGSGVFDGDSPTELDSKMKRMNEFINNVVARLAYMKSNGIKFDAKSDKPMPVAIDDMPKIIKDRGNAIAADLSGKGMSGEDLRVAVRTQVAREFGFVGP